jgi:hypothetical protein
MSLTNASQTKARDQGLQRQCLEQPSAFSSSKKGQNSDFGVALDENTIIAIVGVVIALCVPFVMRALNVGKSSTITTTQVYNLSQDVSRLEKTLDKLEERLRLAENNIIRNERRLNNHNNNVNHTNNKS